MVGRGAVKIQQPGLTLREFLGRFSLVYVCALRGEGDEIPKSDFARLFCSFLTPMQSPLKISFERREGGKKDLIFLHRSLFFRGNCLLSFIAPFVVLSSV